MSSASITRQSLGLPESPKLGCCININLSPKHQAQRTHMQVHSLDIPTTRVTVANSYFFMNQKLSAPPSSTSPLSLYLHQYPYFRKVWVQAGGRTGTSANWNRLHLGLPLQTSNSPPGSTHRQKWQRTPVFLPGKSHGQRSLVGYSPQGHKESDTTGRLDNSKALTGNSLLTRHWAESCNSIGSTSSYHNAGITIFYMQNVQV